LRRKRHEKAHKETIVGSIVNIYDTNTFWFRHQKPLELVENSHSGKDEYGWIYSKLEPLDREGLGYLYSKLELELAKYCQENKLASLHYFELDDKTRETIGRELSDLYADHQEETTGDESSGMLIPLEVFERGELGFLHHKMMEDVGG